MEALEPLVAELLALLPVIMPKTLHKVGA